MSDAGLRAVGVPASGFRRLLLLVPAAAEDVVLGRLWLAGTAGVEELARGGSQVELAATFSAAAVPDGAELAAWASLGVTVLADEAVPDEDWLARYRASVSPIPVGRSLLVDPREPGEAPVEAGERRLLRLPVRAAFGVGSHESTRLAVELLEELADGGELDGRSLLDVGTGTGILAFYALARGARFAVGYDLDLEAAVLAHQNRHLNGLWPALFAGTSGAVADGSRFDLVVVNVIPEEVAGELDAICRLVGRDGGLLFSGVLAERGARLLGDLAARGFVPVRERTAAEWVAFELRRAASRPLTAGA